MTSRKRKAADLTGIRQRGARFQVRIFGGIDPVTGRQLILTGSAATEAEALALRDGFRKQVAEAVAAQFAGGAAWPGRTGGLGRTRMGGLGRVGGVAP
jgi:hypothetical protein